MFLRIINSLYQFHSIEITWALDEARKIHKESRQGFQDLSVSKKLLPLSRCNEGSPQYHITATACVLTICPLLNFPTLSVKYEDNCLSRHLPFRDLGI